MTTSPGCRSYSPDFTGDGPGGWSLTSSMNHAQADHDHDGVGDACDSDADGDGVQDSTEACFCVGTAPGVPVTSKGCSVDQLCPCAAPLGRSAWNGHSEYTACVQGAVHELH